MPAFRTLLALLLLLLAARPTAAQPTSALSKPARPLHDALDARGALRPGAAGSFDATGYRLTTGADGVPRFVAAEPGAWVEGFGQPGAQGWRVNAAAVGPDGHLYIGGEFGEAGSITVNNVARWDGTRWHALGAGIDGPVYALAFDGATLYAGGAFRKAGTAAVRNLARWDGTAWSGLPGGPTDDWGNLSEIQALAVVSGHLYVGGTFTQFNGVRAYGLARWDGAAWSGAGGGLYHGVWSPTQYNVGSIYALAAHGGHLYVGGRITHGGDPAAPVALNGVGRLDPATGTWTALGDGLQAGPHSVGEADVFAFDGTDVYVGGRFATAGGRAALNVARWDGAAWHALSNGIDNEYNTARVSALAVHGGALYAGGGFTTAGDFEAKHMARWDGTAWSPLLEGEVNGVDDYVTALLADPRGGLVAIGHFDHAGPHHAQQVARWHEDADVWTVLGQGVGSGTYGAVNAVAVTAGGTVYVGGSFEHAGDAVAKNVARWDGTRWRPLGPGVDGEVYALATDGTDVYVGGAFTAAGQRSLTHVGRWDEAAETWHPLGSGINGTVRALAVGGGHLYAGGSFTAAGGVDANNVARWNGGAWSSLGGVTFIASSVNALAVDGSVVVIGGPFTTLATPQTGDEWVRVNGIAAWDATTGDWYLLGQGLQTGNYGGTVYALAIAGEALYVGGDFDKAGTTSANGIAVWNLRTGSWGALDAGIGGTYESVQALAVGHDGLYVGGRFATAGGATVNHAARWDGARWSALGAGMDADVRALAAHDGSVYAGGRFETADGRPAYRFAQWRGASAPQPEPPRPGVAAFALDPATLDFGGVRTGATAVLTFTIRNEAAATAALSGTVGTPTGPFRVTAGGGAFTLAPGASREVTVEFAPAGLGVADGTLAVTHDAPNAASPAAVTLRGNAIVQAPGPVVVRNFNPDGPQLVLGAQAGGFVFGTNGYGDRAKATVLTVPAGETALAIDEVSVWFGHKSAAVADQTYTLALYRGTAATGPQGDPLFAGTFRYADVQADADAATPSGPTLHRLPAPVTVDGSFFVVVDFGAYTDPGLAAIASGAAAGRRVAEVWEQAQGGTWHNVSDAWTSTSGQPGTGTDGWQLWIEAAATGATVDREEASLPSGLALEANYPNPFNPATTISYTLPAAGPVRLVVYDVLGRAVATLVDAPQAAGRHRVAFDAGGLASGTYAYRLEAAGRQLTRTMQLVK